MDFEILNSGSDGNSLVLNRSILLDAGVAYKKVEPFVRGLQIVFVSHIHGDHLNQHTIHRIAANRPLVRFAGNEDVCRMFTLAGVRARSIDVLRAGKRYNYGAFVLEPFELYHDVPNLGLKIYMGGEKILYAVDTGYIDVEARNFDAYFIERNHEEAEIVARIAEKQARGEFAYETRAARYHLSQEQAMEFLVKNISTERWNGTEIVFLHAHMEETK